MLRKRIWDIYNYHLTLPITPTSLHITETLCLEMSIDFEIDMSKEEIHELIAQYHR